MTHGRRPLAALALLMLALLWPAAPRAATLEVVYPAPESPLDRRYNDLIEILRGALDHTVATDGPYRMRPSRRPMTEARQLAVMGSRGDLNVLWSSTSLDKERTMQPIRIPLRKGLLGYRIALIPRGTQSKFDKVYTRDDLRRFVIGQGIGWGDVEIYNRNGFRVSTVPYDTLFRMLGAHRIDLFPRGIGEIFNEYAALGGKASGLEIEQRLLIVYPWPYYFFVRKQDQALARRLETGLRAMIRDGSFDAVFRKYNGPMIERARLGNRRIIRLDNPLLPPATPLGDPALWFDPLHAR